MPLKLLLTLTLAITGLNAFAGEWKQLPPIPDREGFAGSFAGVSNNALLVAGGANFPDKKPWEDGNKVWHDTVFVLEHPAGKWKTAGHLPRPLGYGVSATYKNGLICVAGSDQDKHYADAFRLEWSNGELKVVTLPSLPMAIANCSGAMVGDVLYVAGGIEKPKSVATLAKAWKIDWSAASPEWTEIKAWPGSPRMLAAAAGHEGAFWLIGGVDLIADKDGAPQRRDITDAYRYDPQSGWKRIADLPHSVVAAPSPAPVSKNSIYVLGGDDGVQAANPPQYHRGFPTMSLRYDTSTNKWTEAGLIAAPRAALPATHWNDAWVIPGGESRPGIRSPEVWTWTPSVK